MNSYPVVLGECRKGKALVEVNDGLTELVRRIRDTGQPGSITVTLKIHPVGDDSVRLTDEVKVAFPKVPKAPSTFFMNDDGDLSRTPHNQPELFATVEGGKQPEAQPAAGGQ